MIKKIFVLNQKLEKLKVNDYPKHLNPFENGTSINTLANNNNQSLINETTLLIADDINSINSEQIIEMQYGDNNCCSTCCSIL